MSVPYGDVAQYISGRPLAQRVPFGWWYSTPSAGECAVGEAVGANCTWRALPEARILYLSDLMEGGGWVPRQPSKNSSVPELVAAALSAREAMLAVLRQHDAMYFGGTDVCDQQ